VKIAIATDRDFVAAQFGCCPICTVADVIDGHILSTFVIPNPGCNHEFWADLFVRNAVTHVIAGAMGSTAEATFRGRGLHVYLGVRGDVADAVARLAHGELLELPMSVDGFPTCCGNTH
jgi:predicted Fe-Mo cluster-binding NifX family protein